VQQVKQYIESLPSRVITDEARLSQLSQQCEPQASSSTGTHTHAHTTARRQARLCSLYDPTVCGVNRLSL